MIEWGGYIGLKGRKLLIRFEFHIEILRIQPMLRIIVGDIKYIPDDNLHGSNCRMIRSAHSIEIGG